MSCAEQTEMVVQRKFNDWYHHSRDTLAPVLESRNEVLHMIRSTKESPSATILSKLRRLQNKFDEAIDIAKIRWSRHLAQTIHNIPFQPKEAWSNIRLLSAGEKIHHYSTQSIHMRLSSGDLAKNDEEYVRVFVEHFSKVLNNHRKTDKNVINDILLRKFMTELDKFPTW